MSSVDWSRATDPNYDPPDDMSTDEIVQFREARGLKPLASLTDPANFAAGNTAHSLTGAPNKAALPVAPTSTPPIAPVGDAPPPPPDVAALPVAPTSAPKEPERPTSQPASPPTKTAPTPWETPDPLAFTPLPVTSSPTPTPVPTTPSTGFSPNNSAPSLPTPTPATPTASNTPTNPANAFYLRDPNTGVEHVVSKAEYDEYMAHPERWTNGVGMAFAGTDKTSGQVYDPVHGRWYDPGTYQNAAQAQANFDEASGPTPQSGDVLAQLGYTPDARPATTTQPTPPAPVATVPESGTSSGGIVPNTDPRPPIPFNPTQGTNGLPPIPDAPPPPPPSANVPTPSTPATPVPSTPATPTPSVPATPASPNTPASTTDANGLPTTSGAMTAVQLTPTTPTNALTNFTITPGPQTDRYATAQRNYDDWVQESDPQFQAAMRDANRYSAAAGRIGSGQATNSIGDIQTQRENNIRSKRDEFLGNALNSSIEDAYRNIGIAQQQQQFQAGQQQTGFNQQVTLQQLADSEAGQTFQQLMTTMGFNAQQIQQAFENAYRVQTLSDDETGQAFYRALQQAMFGSQGDPSDIYEWLAQLYALPQNYGHAA